MKILQINCVYNTGSTGKIVYDIHSSLKKRGIKSVVCYGRGIKINEYGVYKTASEYISKFNNFKSRYTGVQYNGSLIATIKLLSVIKKEKPDVVHLHCINGFFVNIYKLLDFLKKHKIKTVVTHHAEFLYTGSCPHAYECNQWQKGCEKCNTLKVATHSYIFDRTAYCWEKMKQAFDGFDTLVSVAVSPWVEERLQMSPIVNKYSHCTVLNGIDCDVFKPRDFGELKKSLGLTDEKIIVYVTASFQSTVKGGQYIIDLANRMINNNVKFIVIGNRTPNIVPLPKNIIDIGRVENQIELAKYYSMADLSIITGKRETFSMPVAESLCCGTPVVGFKAGGPESIAISKYCEFVDYGDIDSLLKIVKDKLSSNYEKSEISVEATDIYDKKRMVEQYIQIYREIG